MIMIMIMIMLCVGAREDPPLHYSVGSDFVTVVSFQFIIFILFLAVIRFYLNAVKIPYLKNCQHNIGGRNRCAPLCTAIRKVPISQWPIHLTFNR